MKLLDFGIARLVEASSQQADQASAAEPARAGAAGGPLTADRYLEPP